MDVEPPRSVQVVSLATHPSLGLMMEMSIA
jgi:hypothetical protein